MIDTAVYSKNVPNDKFYTKPEVAKQCISLLDLSSYDLVIEPSAGNGSFSNNITHDNLLSFDICPEGKDITQKNWFDFSLDKAYNNILVIGNPPFGIRNNLSKLFIKKAIDIGAKTIAFILPNVYDKHTLQSVFTNDYRLKKKLLLPKFSFLANGVDYSIPTSFYVWDKSYGEDLRFNQELYKTEDFEFIYKKDATESDFFIFGASPNIVKEVADVSKYNRGYYIKPKQKNKEYLMKRFKELKFIALSCVSGGVAWRTKPEIIKDYIKWDLK